MEERPCTVPVSLSTLEGDRPHPLAEEPGSLLWDAQGPLSGDPFADFPKSSKVD